MLLLPPPPPQAGTPRPQEPGAAHAAPAEHSCPTRGSRFFTASGAFKPRGVRDRLRCRCEGDGAGAAASRPPPPSRGRRGVTQYLAARGGHCPGRPSGRRRGCSPRGPSQSPATPGRSAPASSCPRWSGATPRRSRRD